LLFLLSFLPVASLRHAPLILLRRAGILCDFFFGNGIDFCFGNGSDWIRFPSSSFLGYLSLHRLRMTVITHACSCSGLGARSTERAPYSDFASHRASLRRVTRIVPSLSTRAPCFLSLPCGTLSVSKLYLRLVVQGRGDGHGHGHGHGHAIFFSILGLDAGTPCIGVN
jgi:hypothetical protein